MQILHARDEGSNCRHPSGYPSSINPRRRLNECSTLPELLVLPAGGMPGWGAPDAISGEPRWSCGHAAWLAAVAVARHGRGREPRWTHLAVPLPVAGHHRGRAMTEPLEQAPFWVRVLATPSPRAGRDARRSARRDRQVAPW